MRRSISEGSLIVSHNPKSSISEVYRLLRTKIPFFSKDQELKTVMVTSSQPGEGKTTTISNLAVTYAQEGKKVLLIDADLRKPSLHRVFSQINHQGLSSLLTGHSSIQESVQKTSIDNLWLLPSGPVPANPSELIDSSGMRELLHQIKDQYDVILVDTPSVLSVSDSVIVSALCDGVIMVAAAGKVKKDHLKKAKEQLDHVNARMLGIVLNRVV
ncbi:MULTISPECIES: CpsD/CapB family tyrosine-protein kinase [Paenibacillus]|uniref:non-specific protein-tyrosine kinase n=1 Tax=Paenibacillus lactis TaxID=228574 RepID=A0ABS4F6U4_9BACL|nr:CpsD/CapB family tyrosine-protein kinase [Paenibacillus lactis]MBP1891979.1 capsular exopolysaccharide synthesis family protein [Paenibacillus lactis]MCM3494434.1 CpsD/CapB family tyrosine-protein kinase [Paenibacillus lactis]GIO89221.1 tyrosine protein kinase [Paenibacillus lactis]HAF99421.1 capsular biosynthesis protein [Paenibacillus lactis]